MGGESMMPKDNKSVVKFDVIEMPDKCYIKLNDSGYNSRKADIYIINGETPKKTFKPEWFEISKPIETVEKLGTPQRINYRYELKSGYPVSDLTPAIINESYLPDAYEDVSGLYVQKYDTIDAELESYEFEVNVIAYKKKDFTFPQQPKLNVSYGLLEEIETHPDLLFERPCSLGGKQLYEIVKTHLQSNVDSKYAKMENGYSWRVRVDKRIKLAKSYTTKHDANDNTKKRTTKWIETLHTDKFVTVVHFEDSSSTKIYPPTIYGENVEDLQVKLTEYLDGLVKMCNEPYKECECCSGYGVMIDEKK